MSDVSIVLLTMFIYIRKSYISILVSTKREEEKKIRTQKKEGQGKSRYKTLKCSKPFALKVK